MAHKTVPLITKHY